MFTFTFKTKKTMKYLRPLIAGVSIVLSAVALVVATYINSKNVLIAGIVCMSVGFVWLAAIPKHKRQV
jgi:hypothetical protein